jgi:hypothetical protein
VDFLRADQFHSTDSPIVIHTQKDGAERFDMNSYRVQELMPIFTLMADAWRPPIHTCRSNKPQPQPQPQQQQTQPPQAEFSSLSNSILVD